MLPGRLLGTALALALLVSPHPAHAISIMHPSLEWLCESMPHVAVVEVRPRAGLADPGPRRVLEHALASTKSTLKGDPPDTFDIRICWGGRRLRTGRALLLAFFDNTRRITDAFALDENDSCLSRPIVSREFRVLHGENQIVAAAQSRLERMRREGRPTPRKRLVLAVPQASEAFRLLWSRGSVSLVVPADPEYQATFLRDLRSKYWGIRAVAARHLGAYPGEEAIAALRPLLTDSGKESWVRLGPRGESIDTTLHYPVREAAYASLRELGVDHPPPDGYVGSVPASKWGIRVNDQGGWPPNAVASHLRRH
jgi:hypothetical protein